MKAMVLAAGLGTRLKPLTFEIPKPMVPVLDRPVMAHTLGLLGRQGFDEVIANLHYHPDTIRSYFGDRVQYVYEEELLGTAGGVRNVKDFFGDELVVVVSGDALTDLDLNALTERHKSAGGIATLTVKKVPDTREYGVVIHDSEGRIQGFQEKPDPAEALSHLGNCGIYCFSPEIFDYYFPERPFVDWAQDVFPVLLENDVPFHVHEIDSYWNDVGSLDELRDGTFDVLQGKLGLDVVGTRVEDGLTVGESTDISGITIVETPVWIGSDCRIEEGTRFMGPVVVGDGSRIGAGCSLRDTILFPGSELPEESIMIGAIGGHAGLVEALTPYEQLQRGG
jgi:mannose-1-phosphate guanylyltransferase